MIVGRDLMPVVKNVEHNSQNEFYRSPVGAAESYSNVRLRIKLELDDIENQQADISVKARFWRERMGELIYVLDPEDPVGREMYFSANIAMPEKGCLLWYYFIINVNGRIWYYGNNDARMGGLGYLRDDPPSQSYQITVFNKGADTPAWFRNSVMYQIFPDRFYRKGNTLVEKKGAVFHACWDDKPFYYKDVDTKEIISYDFFGGNLAGIQEKLPYLKDLGISVIYLNPIFESASNHHYDTGDYHKVDPILGTNEDLKKLCEEAKKLGIRIMLDGVFSHTGDDSRYFNKYGHYDTVGAYQSKESPYYEWYCFNNYPNGYESWWGFSTLPNVKEETPSYMNFIINDEDSVLKYWMKQGISGWRLDVVDELPEKFTQTFYKVLKEVDKDAVMLGEVWEDASNKNAYGVSREYLCGQELDSAMNYPFRQAVLDFLLGYADAGQVSTRLRSLQENYPKHNFYAMMNLLGSHDRERILTLLGEAPSQEGMPAVRQAAYRLDGERLHKGLMRMKMAVLWQMTFPGVPSVYYGDEIALQGYRDPYSRGTYDWKNGDPELRQWTRKLIHLRNKHVALQTGKILPIYAKGDVYGYARVIDTGHDVFGAEADNEVFIVLMNRSHEVRHVSLDVRDLATGSMEDALEEREAIAIVRGRMEVDVPPYTGLVYRHKAESAAKAKGIRQCGVLMHPTSLPSPFGIGDLGPEAYKFVDFLAEAGQKVWQILPLNPVGAGDSPYASPSAFAGNPLLISLELLADKGLLTEGDLQDASVVNNGKADYDWARMLKPSLIFKAYINAMSKATPEEKADFQAWTKKNEYWLRDYALFQTLKDWHNGKSWNKWDPEFVRRDEVALTAMEEQLSFEIGEIQFEQYLFYQQWQDLKAYANKKGIKILGDMPIFVSLDSADAWAHQQLFKLDQNGRPYKVAGVPPDYFSKTGQLWGNPQYNWDIMREDGYDWWIRRFRNILHQVDIIRIDHFRGFESFWEVDGDAKTAENGVWKKGPGKPFFDIIRKEIGNIPIVAEDLGVITNEVEELRQACQFPGMKVLQFELHFNENGRINFVEPEDCIVYTSTHDNNTMVGWLKENASRAEVEAIANMLDAAGSPAEELDSRLIEHAYASDARMVIIALQDILQLDGTCRMNVPGVGSGNWGWRMKPGMIKPYKAKWLKALAEKYNR